MNKTGGNILTRWITKTTSFVAPLSSTENRSKQTVSPDIDEDPSDIIRITRSATPLTYPYFLKPDYPQIENNGPTEFNIKSLVHWSLHPSQKTCDGCNLSGYYSFNIAMNNNLLDRSIGLLELNEIQKRGAVFFEKHFSGKRIFALKSICSNLDAESHLIYLEKMGDKIVFGRHCLWNAFSSEDIALLFHSGHSRLLITA